MSTSLTVLAPVAGTVIAMSDVPDPVFAGEIVGPGLAIDPVRESSVTAIAPVAGTVLKLHAHAFVVQADGGRAALVHLGLDTVQLGGAGFTLHVAEGDVVRAGDAVVSWDPVTVEAGGRSPVCPVVALQGEASAVTPLATVGSVISAGDPLLAWS
ncbi:PTS sugar transporter subunit IIA [Cellulomonas aerilata]|uniref:PTS glucose transporter subunit IIA n=1 Tax=Cellulomonas aerilata TaxID=515326 RepID=A0A512DC16_9CELL|nr:PTS glucose transporter subunit IIA [Cellulomonas aerilata]GEO34022.1 PTS glucose transporter subunit IIA [Cellulomonas aerilata]